MNDTAQKLWRYHRRTNNDFFIQFWCSEIQKQQDTHSIDFKSFGNQTAQKSLRAAWEKNHSDLCPFSFDVERIYSNKLIHIQLIFKVLKMKDDRNCAEVTASYVTEASLIKFNWILIWKLMQNSAYGNPFGARKPALLPIKM